MTMKRVGTDCVFPKPVRKEMRMMEPGETCYCIVDERYILRMPHGSDQFLILDNHGSANSYSGKVTSPVRELYPGESITIKFS